MPWIYQKHFSYFTGPYSFYPEKIINEEPPNLSGRASKQIFHRKRKWGCRRRQTKISRVMKDIVHEHGEEFDKQMYAQRLNN
jgi:hypothetical protein